jgi:eukaryotic translation initiation factor 2C
LKLSESNPWRPGFGTRGAPVDLTANYVELLPPPNIVLHRYGVDVSPEAAGRKQQRILQLLLESEEMASHRGNLATDFKSTLISKNQLKDKNGIFEITYRSDGEDEPATGAQVYRVKVQWSGTFSFGNLVELMNSTSLGGDQTGPNKHEYTQALNIFLNHYVKSANNLATIGSSKSFSLASNALRGDLGSGLEVMRGFFSSVRLATSRILVNINVSHGAFYRAGTLPALMNSFGSQNTIALERFLKLVRVQTNHLKEKRNKANQVIPRVKTIFGLARKDDGHGSQHPPRVKQHGAGAKDVEFWLDASPAGAPKAEAASSTNQKGKGAAQSKNSAGGSGKYISVFDFFKTSMSLTSSIL